MTFDQLISTADNSDLHEEDCEDFLSEKGIPITSHSRKNLYLLAWKNGWRPEE